MNFKTEEKPEYVGTVAVKNPWEALHKIRFGQSGVLPFGAHGQAAAAGIVDIPGDRRQGLDRALGLGAVVVRDRAAVAEQAGRMIHGARTALPGLARSDTLLGRWLRGLLERAHRNVVTVALANKLARIAWAVLARDRRYVAVQPAVDSAAPWRITTVRGKGPTTSARGTNRMAPQSIGALET